MRSTRRLAATLTLLAFLPACQPPDPETPTATIAAPTPPASTSTPTAPPSPSSSPSPSPEDYTVPAVIDDAYVQRVLTALYHLESEALRQMVASGDVTSETEGLIRALVRSDLAERDLDAYREGASEGFPGVLRPPGDQQITLHELIAAKPDCIFAQTLRDFTAVLSDPGSQNGITYVQLLLKDEGQDPFDSNPTPWIVGGSVLRADEGRPEDPCEPF